MSYKVAVTMFAQYVTYSGRCVWEYTTDEHADEMNDLWYVQLLYSFCIVLRNYLKDRTIDG